jgi:hypothetical protein
MASLRALSSHPPPDRREVVLQLKVVEAYRPNRIGSLPMLALLITRHYWNLRWIFVDGKLAMHF